MLDRVYRPIATAADRRYESYRGLADGDGTAAAGDLLWAPAARSSRTDAARTHKLSRDVYIHAPPRVVIIISRADLVSTRALALFPHTRARSRVCQGGRAGDLFKFSSRRRVFLNARASSVRPPPPPPRGLG